MAGILTFDINEEYVYTEEDPPFLKAYIHLKDDRKVLINPGMFKNIDVVFTRFYSEHHGNYIIYMFRNEYDGAVVLVDLIQNIEKTITTLGESSMVEFFENGVAIMETKDTYGITIFNYATGEIHSIFEGKSTDLRLIDTCDVSEYEDNAYGSTWSLNNEKFILTYPKVQIEYDLKTFERIIKDIPQKFEIRVHDIYPQFERKYLFRGLFYFSHHWMGQLLDKNAVHKYTTTENIVFPSEDKYKNTNMLNVIILLHNAGIIKEDDAKYVRHPRFVELYQKTNKELEELRVLHGITQDPFLRYVAGMDLTHYEKTQKIKQIMDKIGFP